MKLLLRLGRAVATVESALVVFLLGIMTLLGFTQVVLRNFFSSGILWADTFLRQLVLWVAFLGASLAVRERKHLNVDVLTRFMSERGKKLARLVTDVFAGVVCVVFLKASLTFVQNEIHQGTVLFLEIPTWYFQLIIPVGYALLSFRFLILNGVVDLQALTRKSTTESDPG